MFVQGLVKTKISQAMPARMQVAEEVVNMPVRLHGARFELFFYWVQR